MAQDNNHGTSEAAALYVGGTWLSRFSAGSGQRRARRWARIGRYWLENRVCKLTGEDGGFSQYSTNYHRLFLVTLVQAELWRRRLGDAPFTSSLVQRCKAAADWLAAVTNAESGNAPNLGANDGADAFNLMLSDYRDYRPAAALATMVFGAGDRTEPTDEISFADLPAQAKRSRTFPDFGLALLNPRGDGGGAYAFLRFPVRRFRPSHADPLHFDLWTADGRNLLRDGGTFSYADPEWSAYFSGIAAHNTVQFGDREPMPRISRFLFADWIQGSFETLPDAEGWSRWSGRYTDAFGAWHRRTVEAKDDSWRIVDEIGGTDLAPTIRWRLLTDDWQSLPGGARGQSLSVTVAGDTTPDEVLLVSGWESLRYLEKSACPVLKARFPKGTRRIETTIALRN